VTDKQIVLRKFKLSTRTLVENKRQISFLTKPTKTLSDLAIKLQGPQIWDPWAYNQLFIIYLANLGLALPRPNFF